MKVCVVGLGVVGLPVARYCLDKGLEVYGYDIDPEAIERAKFITKKFGPQKLSSEWDEIPPSDIYLVCVSTGLSNGRPDLSSIFEVCEKIAEYTPNLVSIESTLTPGSSKKIFKDVFNENIRLVHVPHRYWPLDPERYGIKHLRVIGAVDMPSLRVGIGFYKDVLGVPLHTVLPIEVAEIAKIVENAHRYLQIAFAEELKMACDDLGLNFRSVREACNTKRNVNILEARDGIGGSCLPKDTKYFMSMTSHNRILDAAMDVDLIYREMKGK